MEAMSTTNKPESDAIIAMFEMDIEFPRFAFLSVAEITTKVHVTALVLLYARSKAITLVRNENEIDDRTIYQAT